MLIFLQQCFASRFVIHQFGNHLRSGGLVEHPDHRLPFYNRVRAFASVVSEGFVTKAGSILRPKSRVWLPLAFLAIIATFIAGNLVALFYTRATQDKDRAIAQNAMVSIQE